MKNKPDQPKEEWEKAMAEKLLNLVLTFKVRSVVRQAQPVEGISEVDIGVLERDGVNRILEIIRQARKEGKL